MFNWKKCYENIKAGKVREARENSKEFKKFLLEASNAYYNTSEILITDDIYDVLREFYEDNFENLKDGAPAVENKVKHTAKDLLGSLDKVHTIEDFNKWITGTVYTKLEVLPDLVCSYKYDGLSVALDIDERKGVIKAYSRGQDGFGQDLTSLFSCRTYDAAPIAKCLEGGGKATIRCEAIMTKPNFQKYSEYYLEKTGKMLADARTAVASIFSTKDNEDLSQYITLVFLDIFLPIPAIYHEKMSLLNRLCGYWNGKNLKDFYHCRVKETFMFFYDADEDDYVTRDPIAIGDKSRRLPLEKFYNHVENTIRPEADFMMDGLVFELVSDGYRKKLGMNYTDGKARPNWGMALKFHPASAITTLEDVELDLSYSASGRITPTARITPTVINGKTYKRVSLSNWKRIEDENIRLGMPMMLTINGDVLGYLTPIHEEGENKKFKKIPVPKSCPICGSEVKSDNDGIWLHCTNPECSNKQRGRILNYFTTMRIKGISRSTIDMFSEAGLWSSIKNLYDCDYDALKKPRKEGGMGVATAENIENAIAARLKVYDYEFFGAWNWPGIGRTVMQSIFREIPYKAFIKGFNSKDKRSFILWLSNIEGVGNILAKNIFLGMHKDYDEIEYILENYVDLVATKKAGETGMGDGKSYKVVVTGDLEICDRESFKSLIANYGHKMVSAISSKVDYLITNFPNSGTVKIKKANELGIKVINEKQFLELTGIERK